MRRDHAAMATAGRAASTLLLVLAAFVLLLAGLALLATTRGDVVAPGAPAAVVAADARSAGSAPREAAPAPAPEALQAQDVDLDADAMADAEEDRRAELAPCVLESWGVARTGSERAACAFVAVDSEDRAVPGATVELWGLRGGSGGGGMQPQAVLTTDDAGRAAAELPLEQPLVRIVKPGVGCSGSVWLDELLPSADQPRLVLVPLLPDVAVAGLVLRDDGTPVPDAALRLRVGADAILRITVHPAGAGPADADGRFAFAAHAADDVLVQALAAGSSSPWLPVTGAAARAGRLVLRLAGDFAVRGHVLDAQGAPRVAASVTFVPELPWTPDDGAPHDVRSEDVARAVSDEAGAFEVAVPLAGRGWLLVESEASGLESPVAVTLDAAHPVVEVTLRAGGRDSIVGRVLLPDGRPLPDARVSARPVLLLDGRAGLPGALRIRALLAAPEAVTDAEGRFTLDGLPAQGSYDLLCAWGHGPKLVKLRLPGVAAGTRDVVLALREWHAGPASLALLVTARATGAPVTGSRVELQPQPRRSADAGDEWLSADDPQGRFECTGLSEDDVFDVIVSADGFAPAVRPGVRATTGGEPVRVELELPGALALDVRSAGRPVPWARVAVRPLDAPTVRSAARRGRDVRTGDDGRASLVALTPGRWRLEVRSGDRSASREVSVPAGFTAREVVELR